MKVQDVNPTVTSSKNVPTYEVHNSSGITMVPVFTELP